MSISLPNGTFIPAPSSSNASVSAAVTRILHLANFTPDLKTRDLQAMFKEWEGEKGGFRIKWVDDTNALVVFADANVAKRAYLTFLLHPPPAFTSPALIKPYDRPDAAQIIAALSARAMGHRAGASSTMQSIGNLASYPSGSISGLPNGLHGVGHDRTSSLGGAGGLNGYVMPLKTTTTAAASRGAVPVPTRGHGRSGSASSAWGKQSMSGALSFPSSASGRLPTHNEKEREGVESATTSYPSRSASSSSGEDPVVLLPPQGKMGSVSSRRDSMSAEKALREVQRALESAA